MSAIESEGLSGFLPSDSILHVTGYELKVVRKWQRDLLLPATGPKFSLLLRGVAVAKGAYVGVIGKKESCSEFELNIYSAGEVKASWERIRRIEQLIDDRDISDSVEQRLLLLQSNLLDKNAPTALLSAIVPNIRPVLICDIPEETFKTLADDLIHGRVNTIEVGVQWAIGLLKPAQFGIGRPTWGMFGISGAREPQPLWGHVSLCEWTPEINANVSKSPESSYELTTALDRWMASFHEDSKGKEDELWRYRIKGVLRNTGTSAIEWHLRNNQDCSVEKLTYILNHLLEFLKRLDGALHWSEGPFHDEKLVIWRHRNVRDLYNKTKASQRVNLIDDNDLSIAFYEYIKIPWIKNPYLDWLFLDVMVITQIVSAMEVSLQQIGGIAYELADGVQWKTSLLRLGIRLLSFFVTWGLPAIVCYFVAFRSVTAAVITGGLWYGLNILSLAWRIWSKMSILISTGQTPHRRLTRLADEMQRAYQWLAGPVLHVDSVRCAFDRAAENGVLCDQRIFYVLDRLSKENPSVWENQIGYSEMIAWP